MGYRRIHRHIHVGTAKLFPVGLALLGFVPIGSICLALFGILPLHVSVSWLIFPAAGLAIAVGLHTPALGRQALRGLASGMLATAIYDSARLTFVLGGVWGDFIPTIGALALANPSASPAWGYLYRYLGDGGALGMTFALLPWRSVRSGLVFGIGICLGLFGTLLLAPMAQATLFRLTPFTASAALLGHLIYGGALGWLLREGRSG